MKNRMVALFILCSSIAFGNEIETIDQISFSDPFAREMNFESESLIDKGSLYFRAVSDMQPLDNVDLFPGLGVGFRRSFGHSGVDISAYFSSGRGWTNKFKQTVWSAPKVSYLYYLTANKGSALYTGLGLSFGGIALKERGGDEAHSKFIGLLSHGTIGYEFLRASKVSSFIELNVTQAAIPKSLSGNFPTPVCEFSVGAGF